MLSACTEEILMSPTLKKIPHKLKIHGDVRIDDYYWLNERNHPDVLAYLEEENTYTAKIMAKTADLQEILFHELKSRVKPDEESVPYKYGNYFYYYRYEKDRDYPIYYRKQESVTGDEEILLDVNKVAQGHNYYDVRGFEASPNQKYGAFLVDTVGRRFYTLHFIDCECG